MIVIKCIDQEYLVEELGIDEEGRQVIEKTWCPHYGVRPDCDNCPSKVKEKDYYETK